MSTGGGLPGQRGDAYLWQDNDYRSGLGQDAQRVFPAG